jgi:hypothetical protein
VFLLASFHVSYTLGSHRALWCVSVLCNW